MQNKIKKSILLSLILIFIFSCSSIVNAGTSTSVIVESGSYADFIEWELDNEGVLTLRQSKTYDGWEPHEYEGIGDFSDNFKPYKIKKVIVEEGTVFIPNFSSCYNLTEVVLPNSLSYIGFHTFENLKNLKTVHLGNGLKSIEFAAFAGCTNLTSITIPSSVTTIDYMAFSGCTNLKSLIILNGIEYIDAEAFANCTSLTSVSIPDSVTEFGSGVFMGCKNLASVTLPNGLVSISGEMFSGCSKLTSIYIPHSITHIGYKAFYECGLTSLNLPYGVTSIDSEAFSGCPFTSVVIPSSIEDWIGAFSGCTSLKKAEIRDGVSCVSGEAFKNCSSLTSVIIPDSVTVIYFEAFSGCTNLASVVLPQSIEEIWEKAFNSNTILCGTLNSYAHAYAKANNLKFSCISHKNIITLKAVKPSCTKSGLTEGKKCVDCGMTFVPQKVVKAKGHVLNTKITKATTKSNGKVYKACKICSYKSTNTTYKASIVKLSYKTATYNGKIKNPTIIVKNSKGKTISSDNYTITKSKGRTNVGKYSYTINFKNKYKGSKKLILTINPKSTTMVSATPAKKSFTVKWTKVSKQVTGYEIMYATNKSFTKGKKTVKTTKYSTTYKKITKLKSNQKYWVKVRTYKTVDGQKYYSAWTKAKTVRAK